jgi:N-methylhydantoinase B
MSPTDQRDGIDPITFSVVMNRIDSILEEMGVAMARTAFSALLSLTHDFSCCVYDTAGRQVGMVDALPIHTNSMHLFLEEVRSFFADDIAPGDLFIANSPYAGNTHVGDLAMCAPVFLGDEHLLWVAIRAHQLDVGAPVPHSSFSGARDVWGEGLTIPPLKLYDRGALRRDVIEMYLQNLRWRDLLDGDLMAQVGSTTLGVQRLGNLCERHGADFMHAFVERAIEYASRRAAEEIEAMTPGSYAATAWYDEPAPGVQDVPISCEVRVQAGEVEVEFVDPPLQVDRGVNASRAVLLAGGGIPLMMMLDPDIPHNHGCLERVRVEAPEGTICNAAYPASTSLATIHPGDVMQESVARALAASAPDRAIAGNARWALIPMLSGDDPRTGERWGHQLLNGGGGGGAAKGCDGWPLLTTSAARGGLRTASIEHTELLHPLLIEQWEIAPDSMGLGEFIGGPGVRFTWRPLDTEVEMVYDSDGLRNPPFGLFGATAGAGGGAYLEDVESGARVPLGSAVHTKVTRTQRWVGISSGGGGYGQPLDRPAEQVRDDVRDGLYSAARAREIFGVMLDLDGLLDEEATAAARERRRETRASGRAEIVVPGAPGASADFLSPLAATEVRS